MFLIFPKNLQATKYNINVVDFLRIKFVRMVRRLTHKYKNIGN